MMKKNLIINSLLLLSILFISCSKYRKYEGTYQMADYTGLRDVFEVKIKNDSVHIGEVYYVHEKIDRAAKKLTQFEQFPMKFLSDTLFAKSGDTLRFFINGNGTLSTDFIKNDTLRKEIFIKKKFNFRLGAGTGVRVRF